MERKNEVMADLFNEKVSRERVFQRLDEEARRFVEEISKISSDVVLHHESILQSIEQDTFTKIMHHHKHKLQDIDLFF